MFALLMERYALIQVSILLSVISQMGRNGNFGRFGGTPVSHSWNPG